MRDLEAIRTGLSRFARLGLAVAALAISSAPALALCPVCNASVRFDESLAQCFADRLDGELQRLGSEGRGFVIVDLSGCKKAGGRSTLPTDPGAPDAAAKLDDSFVADGASLKCLGDAVANRPGKLDPSFLFDLTRICP